MKSAKFFVVIVLVEFAYAQNRFQQAIRSFENFESFPIKAINNFLNPQSQQRPVQTYVDRNPGNVYVYHTTYDDEPSYQQPAPSYPQQSSSACDSYWSLQSDYERYGVVTIPNPDRRKNVIRLTLTLAAQLPSVSF